MELEFREAVAHQRVVVHAAAVEHVHRVRARGAAGRVEAADALEAAALLLVGLVDPHLDGQERG